MRVIKLVRSQTILTTNVSLSLYTTRKTSGYKQDSKACWVTLCLIEHIKSDQSSTAICPTSFSALHAVLYLRSVRVTMLPKVLVLSCWLRRELLGGDLADESKEGQIEL